MLIFSQYAMLAKNLCASKLVKNKNLHICQCSNILATREEPVNVFLERGEKKGR
jgi:hypothetical protein